MSKVSTMLIGCSGWNYGDSFDKGGWVGSFYPDTKIRRLGYYSRYFSTAEFDAIFYEKFYSRIGEGTFYGMIKATPTNFQFSVKVPETITHVKRLDPSRGAVEDFWKFLEKISPLENANKLGAILIQLPPSFSVNEFRQVEKFLDAISDRQYELALEFRHPSWHTEGPWELLRHYNVAAVMTDSPDTNLYYLSEIALTANHCFIRLHGRNRGFWYNYLYNKEELNQWAKKVQKLLQNPELRTVRIYFNNHYGAAAVLNALEFGEIFGNNLDSESIKVKDRLLLKLRTGDSQQTL